MFVLVEDATNEVSQGNFTCAPALTVATTGTAGPAIAARQRFVRRTL